MRAPVHHFKQLPHVTRFLYCRAPDAAAGTRLPHAQLSHSCLPELMAALPECFDHGLRLYLAIEAPHATQIQEDAAGEKLFGC